MWQCITCGCNNDDRMNSCRFCGMPRPEDAVSAGKGSKKTAGGVQISGGKSDSGKGKAKKLPIIIAGIAVAAVAALALGAGAFVEFRYRKAGEYYAAGNYEKAEDIYSGISWYKDSKDMAAEASAAPVVAEAYALLDAGDYKGARELIEASGCTGESAKTLIEETYIVEARRYMVMGDYESADAALAFAGDSATAESLRNEVSWVLGGTMGSGSNSIDGTGATGSLELPALGGGLGGNTQDTSGGLVFSTGGGYYGADSGALPDSNYALDGRRITAGSNHTAAVRSNGSVVAVGRNDHGQCDVTIWRNIVEISAGSLHTVGLKADGTVMTVGDNEYGQCNTGSWSGIKQISAGGHYTVGVRGDGTVAATGVNMYGQCEVQDWYGIREVSAGYWHTVGLCEDGSVVAVGYNEYGQCNVGDWRGIVQVSAGRSHTVALRNDGTVVAAGDNEYGQCNVSAWQDIVAVKAGAAYTVGLKADGTMVMAGFRTEDGMNDVSAWTGIEAIAVGGYHTVGVKADGTVVATGWDIGGACGTDSWDIQ